MEARAIARHVRVAPPKAKIIADLVRGKTVEQALEILKYSNRAAAKPIQKTVMSAMHNLANYVGRNAALRRPSRCTAMLSKCRSARWAPITRTWLRLCSSMPGCSGR